MYAYTNINFTDKQKEDVTKLYDLVVSSGLLAAIIEAIPSEEYTMLFDGIKRSADAIYTHRNSVLGILEAVSTDYSNLNFDATEIRDKLADPNNMTLLKEIMTKLG